MSEPSPWSREGGQPQDPPPHEPPPYQPPPFQAQGYEPQGYPPQGYQPQDYPPQDYPAPPYQHPGDQPPAYPQPSWSAGPYGAPSPYGASPYGFGPQPHRQGTAVFTLGILSIVFAFLCGSGLVLGIIALALSGSALREIAANPGAYSNGQKVRAGRICAIIGVAISALALVARASDLGQSFG